MGKSIVQCDGCGAHAQRAEDAAAPDFWYYLESVDHTFGKGGIYIVWACSIKCREGLWRKGPGHGQVDDRRTADKKRRDAAKKKPERVT